MKVSVCVPTHNRPRQLADLLEALATLEPVDGGHEIVVVDDASDPVHGVPDLLASAAGSLPLRVEVFSTNRGAATARETAWRMATGDWIAFTDDDCVPTPGWLVELLGAAERTGADVVQGRTAPDPERRHLLDRPFSRSLEVSSMTGHFQTANIAYRRSLLEAVGGFDLDLRLACDDTELAWRAIDHGAATTFADQALVHHEVAERTWRDEVRGRRRWQDAVKVVARHPAARQLAWKPYVYRREHTPWLALAATAPMLLHRRTRLAWLAAALAVPAADVVRGGSPAGAAVNLQMRLANGYETALLARASVRERSLLL